MFIQRGGCCTEHGKGVRKHYKPLITKEEGPHGRIVRKMTKKVQWVCDLEPDVRKMNQSRLSFTRTSLKMTEGDNVDTQQGDLGVFS